MGAAAGQATAKVRMCAMTSCLVSRSSRAAAAKSMLLTCSSISATCSGVMGRPNSYVVNKGENSQEYV